MKVFMINSVAGVRSTGRICTDLAELLHQRGHTCRIAYGRVSAPDFCKDYTVKIGSELGAYARFATGLVLDDQGKGARRATRRLIREIQEFDPDIIHLHNIHGYYLNIKMLFDFLSKADIPVVWTLHDCWTFTGHCSHFDFVGCDKWKDGSCRRCPVKTGYPPSLIVDRSAKNFKEKKALFTSVKNVTLVTPSDWLRRLAEQSFLGKYESITVNNGIDLSRFKPTPSNAKERLGIADKKMILGVASIWGKRKGLLDFHALAGLLDDEWRIVLVGLNKHQIAALPQNVIGIERTNSITELAELYTAADVFVNPTHEEVFGLVNIEARACGTPVVTYRTGGCVEAVDESYCRIVDKFDVQGLHDAILSVSKRDGINADEFDKNQKYLEYISLYERIFAGR